MRTKKIISIIVLLLFIIVGCLSINQKDGLDGDISADELLSIYYDGIYYADQDKIVSVFPDFMSHVVRINFSIEFLNANINATKMEYGDNFQIKYKIESIEKVSDIIFESIKRYVSNFQEYVEPSECYMLNGYLNVSGEKKSEDIIFNGEIGYCKFNNLWRLIMG